MHDHQSDILLFTRLAGSYAERAESAGGPILAAGLRRLAAGYLDIAKQIDAQHAAEQAAPRGRRAAPAQRDAA
jgi:hypothetical protein